MDYNEEQRGGMEEGPFFVISSDALNPTTHIKSISGAGD